MRPVHLILLIGFNLCWAASYSTFKALADHLTAGGVVTLRFLVALAVLLPFWKLFRGELPKGRALALNLVMGVIVFCLGPRLQVIGVRMGQAGDASVLVALEPLITSVAAAIFLRESIRPLRWAGFAVGMLGVVLLSRVWRPDFQLPGLTANAIFVSSFVCECAFSIMGKPLIQRCGLMKVLVIGLLGGAAANVALDGGTTFLAVQQLPLSAWGQILFLGLICSAAGYAVWLAIIRVVPVNVVAVTLFLQPVAGVIIAVIWIGETAHWGQLWGSLAIVCGLALGLQRRRKTSAAPNESGMG